jgi:tetratricopeptide (TPR) repeat protein
MMKSAQDILPDVIKAESLIQQSDLIQAKQILKAMVESGNAQAYLELALGDLCSNLQERGQAREHYQKAIEKAVIEEDVQVKLAAKSNLLDLEIQDIWDEFNALPKVEQIDELLASIPENCCKKKPFRNLQFLSSACVCASNPNTPGVLNGRWIAIPFAPFFICKRAC